MEKEEKIIDKLKMKRQSLFNEKLKEIKTDETSSEIKSEKLNNKNVKSTEKVNTGNKTKKPVKKTLKKETTTETTTKEKNKASLVPMKAIENKPAKIEKVMDKTYIIPLGGLEEIGKNMTVIQYRDEIIIVDIGLSFPEDEHLGIDVIIPSFSYLESNKEKIKGLLITHGHEDHIGGIPYFYQKLGNEIPMYGGKLTLELTKSKFERKDVKLPKSKIIKGRTKVQISKYFSAEFISVTHSIPDCYAICIKTPTSTILHTGDFKVDLTPIDGEGFDFAKLSECGEKGVDLLLSDSTNAGIPGFTPSERTVGESIDHEVNKAKGRVILALFASHVHRLQSIINIAKKHKRKIAVDGRSMVKMFEICTKLGYLKAPKEMLIDLEKAEKMDESKVMILCTGTQGEPLAALSRIANGSHKRITLRQSDTVVISATPIPGNEKAAYKNVNQLLKKHANVVFEKMEGIHVSGHGCQEEQKLMLNLIKPTYFMPVHGEFMMLQKHKKLAVETGVLPENVILAENGLKLELTPNSFRVAGKVPSGITLIDGLGIGDISNTVLKDRQNLADDGIVVISVYINSNGKFGEQVEIITRGFIYNKEAQDLLSETKKLVKLELQNLESKDIREISKIKHSIKYKVGGYLSKKVDRTPIILPVIMEI